MPHHLRAPARHGELLLAPEGSLTDLVRANEARLVEGHLWGRPLTEVRAEARAEVYQLATRYTSDLIGPESVAFRSAKGRSFAEQKTTLCPPHWIIGGHQPELFHPGVWVKNAVVAGLATQLGGVGLNLVVDNDVCTGASVRVPCRPDTTGMTSLDWDVPRPQSPWEERPLPNAELFASFGERCREQLRPWGIDPLAAGQDWGASPERGVVDRLVQLRARFERSVGVRNLELKVSDLADTQCFRRFLIGGLRDAEVLLAAYNSALTDYRTLHRIRSRSHPVPALEATTEGIEVPFWVWRAGEVQRHRLFVQATGSGTLRLHDGQREVGAISATSETTALAQLQDLRGQGWKIRPRALTLTLFCRICLGSVFVHGIGGAKYDEMTDALMQRWLGLTPPAIIVATATLRLFERFAGPPLEPEIAEAARVTTDRLEPGVGPGRGRSECRLSLRERTSFRGAKGDNTGGEIGPPGLSARPGDPACPPPIPQHRPPRWAVRIRTAGPPRPATTPHHPAPPAIPPQPRVRREPVSEGGDARPLSASDGWRSIEREGLSMAAGQSSSPRWK